jgi:hypothetical protein
MARVMQRAEYAGGMPAFYRDEEKCACLRRQLVVLERVTMA